MMAAAIPTTSVVTGIILPHCSPPAGGAPVGGPVQVEAYRETKYSRIRFCNRFFNLSSLQEAITEGKKKSAAARNSLEIWNSRARVFFHEATHLGYFMNVPGRCPYVIDAKFSYIVGEKTYI